ncbi:MAG: hypothetical protein J7524_05165 [Roseofilum sp. Belize BBD 4]|uniref:hypothetical protein n=1 Tax=Roseofilum sp. Belize BBD 4 TaxID=2821500 RepID=UPI001B10BBA6|nr:hypothetical protein [Roseofilum sp. Belize BBD 4]MBP0032541.1 hypothetical protein [Roseofilum sp. Belize BBD 4]
MISHNRFSCDYRGYLTSRWVAQAQANTDESKLEPLLDFTVEESGAAIALLGCDCIQ